MSVHTSYATQSLRPLNSKISSSFFQTLGVWRIGVDISSIDECVRAIVAGMGDVCISNHVHLFICIPRPVSAGPG